MTGRKVTRRASMRRKSFRSPSATRSGTPRSTTSEPLGKSSYASSLEQLDHEDSIVSKKSVSNHSLERLRQDLSGTHINETEQQRASVASIKGETQEDPKEDTIPVNSESSEERASVILSQTERQSMHEQPAAVAASKESLAKSLSNASFNDIKSEKSKESLVESVPDRSKSSLNVDSAEFIPESVKAAAAENETPYPEVNESEFIKKSTEDLHSISLEEPTIPAEVEENKEEGVKEEAAAVAGTTEDVVAPADSTEAPVPVDNDESAKKTCSERAARCRCIIS